MSITKFVNDQKEFLKKHLTYKGVHNSLDYSLNVILRLKAEESCLYSRQETRFFPFVSLRVRMTIPVDVYTIMALLVIDMQNF